MSSSPRASNPTGPSLLDKSTAHPGSLDKSIFEKKTGSAAGSSVGQGTVNPNYLKECREDNPEPASTEASKDAVALSNCRFLTPVEELRCDEKFEMAVDAKVTGSANLENVTFRLYSFLTKDGKEERSRTHTWAGNGKPVDPKADPVVVKATGKLVYETGTDLSKPIPFEIEAKYCQQEPAKSPRAEVANKNVAHWMGGDDLHFATDGEFPLLGSDAGLIQVLSSAVKRFEKPVEKGETVICFGFASSAGGADHNRKLSLRRAQVVKAILDRDENAWNDLAKANFGTSDIQQFMADLHAACGWECDPGAVDGQAGPKTKEAIASFQRECNSRYGTHLKEDGICGPRTWSAVLRVILGQIQAALGQDPNTAPSWPKANWGNAGKGVYGNGEDFATGGDKPQERSVQITFFLIGAEQRLEDPKPGQKATIKDNPVQDEKLVEKKKIEGGGAVKGVDSPVEDGEPFYNSTTDEIFIVPKAKLKDFEREWKMLELVMPIVGNNFFPDSNSSPEESQLRLQATYVFMKRLQEASSIDSAEKLARNAKAEIEADKQKVKANPKLADRLEVKGASMESGWYHQIYWAGGKRMVWVRGEKIKSHARWFNRKQVQAQIRKEMESEAADKKKESTGSKPATSAEIKLLERDLFEAQKGTWAPSVENWFADKGMQEMLKDSRHFQAGVAVQALRWAAEGKYGVNVNWTKDKTIKAEAKAEGSFSLMSAQGHFDIFLTGKDGIDIITQIKRIEPKLVRPDAKPIRIQAVMTFTGSAFTGVCGSASAGLGLSFKDGGDKEAGVEAGVEAFAGAKVGVEATVAMKMQLFEENKPAPEWKDLSNVTYGAWAAIGFGVEASFKLGYYSKKFRIQARVGLVLKGGAGHYLKAGVHLENLGRLIWTLGSSVNWNEMGKILGKEVWHVYQTLMLHSALTGKALQAGADALSSEIDKIMQAASSTGVSIFEGAKFADDTFDNWVPGYSVAKKFSPVFFVTKETYQLLKSYNQGLQRGASAINTVSKIKDWKYVTRELKHNMLVDLCQTGSGWLGPFSGEAKEDAIIKIMSSIRDKTEYAWVMDGLKKQNVDLDSFVDFSQQEKLDAIRAKYR